MGLRWVNSALTGYFWPVKVKASFQIWYREQCRSGTPIFKFAFWWWWEGGGVLIPPLLIQLLNMRTRPNKLVNLGPSYSQLCNTTSSTQGMEGTHAWQ